MLPQPSIALTVQNRGLKHQSFRFLHGEPWHSSSKPNYKSKGREIEYISYDVSWTKGIINACLFSVCDLKL